MAETQLNPRHAPRPFGALLDFTGGCGYDLFRGNCPYCGGEIGVALGTGSGVLAPPIPFDAIAGPDDGADLTFVLHDCPEAPRALGVVRG